MKRLSMYIVLSRLRLANGPALLAAEGIDSYVGAFKDCVDSIQDGSSQTNIPAQLTC